MKDVPCAYCDASVVGASFVLCAKCEVPIHRDCWAESPRCPTYGCAATESLDPALALFRRAAPPVPAVRDTMAVVAPPPATPLENALGRAVRVVESVVSAIAEGATGLMTGEPPPARSTVPTSSAVVAAAPASPPMTTRETEIAELEAELHRIRMATWLRTLVMVSWVVMFPMLTKMISKHFIFPWVAILFGMLTWPSRSKKSAATLEKQLTKRIAELEAKALPAAQ